MAITTGSASVRSAAIAVGETAVAGLRAALGGEVITPQTADTTRIENSGTDRSTDARPSSLAARAWMTSGPPSASVMTSSYRLPSGGGGKVSQAWPRATAAW